ncbi:MAG: polyphosphate polymerase domain-containing protein [Lachnospiraceae bacterium]|nr:polyphosphate polymerase domain-containing protein [Lachnospiraceae bacterium]
MKDQMIFKRYELKYMLTQEQYNTVIAEIKKHMNEDEHGHSTIQSLYFDTPDFLLIRRSIEKPMYKEKLRLRSYGVADKDTKVFLELKKKYDKVVYKRRVSTKEDNAVKFFTEDATEAIKDSQIRHELQYAKDLYDQLAPRVLLSYERDAFYDKEDSNFRVTFDSNVLWRDTDVNLHSGIYGNEILPKGYVLMEVKVAGGIPMWMTKLLSENKIYKRSFSKYGTAYKTMLARSGKIRQVAAAAYNLRGKGAYTYA